MSLIEKLNKTKFSPVQNYIKEYVLNNKHEIESLSLKQLADKTFTSSATIIRFVKKIGFENYSSFQKEFIKEIKCMESSFQAIDANYPFDENDTIYTISSKIAILAKETINNTYNLITHDNLQQAVKILMKAKTIHLFAISYPLLYGQEFKFNMMRIGKNVSLCDQVGEEYFVINLLSHNDCALFISYSGEREKSIKLAKICKQKGIPIIVITNTDDNRLKKYADVVLCVSTKEKLYSKIGTFTNGYSFKVILDILYSCYFSFDYKNNLEMRKSVSHIAEDGYRCSSSDILKEK